MAGKAKNDDFWWGYYKGKFDNHEQVEKFIYTCIGPSKNSPIATPEKPIGTRLTIVECREFKCTCRYSHRLIELANKLKVDRKEDYKIKDKVEKELMAKKLLEDESEDKQIESGRSDSDGESRASEKDRETKKGKQEVEERKQEAEEDDVSDFLFGDD